jgi:hypothetical protein
MMATLNQLFGKMPTIPGIAELLKPTANAPRTKLAVLADSFFPTAILRTRSGIFQSRINRQKSEIPWRCPAGNR